MNFFYSMKYIIALLLCMISILSCNTNKEISVKTNTIENDSITFYRLNDTIKISLEKNFNGGYEWFFEKNEIVALIYERDSTYKNKESDLYEYSKTFILKPTKKGITKLNFYKKRKFENDSLAIKNAYTQKISVH